MGRVAILDDSKVTLELLEFILKERHEVIVYDDPRKFLQEFAPGAFALILVDLAMPEIDGYQVFRHVRALDPDVPICAITAVVRPGERERCLQMGFCEYFAKPIPDVESFRMMVYSHVGKCSNPPHESQVPEQTKY
jgi:CheY-like chemotaxis protein